jgi:ABC-type uncharacterized transport system permease subunit
MQNSGHEGGAFFTGWFFALLIGFFLGWEQLPGGLVLAGLAGMAIGAVWAHWPMRRRP